MPTDISRSSSRGASAGSGPNSANDDRRTVNGRLLFPGAVAIAVLVMNWPFLHAPVSGLDEGSVLAYGSRVFHGAVPYRDFVSFYGPANPYVIGAAMEIFGPNVSVERLIGFGYKAAVVLGFYALPLPLPRWARAALSLVVAVSILPIGGGGPAAASFMAASGALVAAVAVITRGSHVPSRGRFFVGGLCLGAAVLYRFDFALPAAMLAVPLVWGRPRDRVSSLLCGALFPTALFVALLLTAGLEPFLATLRDLARSGPGRRLPFSFPSTIGFALLSLLVGPAVVLAGAAWLARRGQSQTARLLCALGLALAGLIPYGLSRADRQHVQLQYGMIAALLLAGLLWIVASRAAGHTGRVRETLSFACVGAAAAGFLWPTGALQNLHSQGARLLGIDRTPVTEVAVGDRRVLLPPGPAADIAPVVKMVQQLGIRHPRIFVGPTDLRTSSYNDAFMYYLLAAARPASRYWELNPGTANRKGSSLRNDLSSADLLLLTTYYNDFERTNRPGVVVENGLNTFVSRNFCRITTSGRYTLLRRCHRRE